MYLKLSLIHLVLLGCGLPWIYASPSQRTIDRLETILYEGFAEGNFVFFALVGGCVKRDDTPIAAQWVRLAYHDMATHNVDDGSGGLDMSIAFELDRPQNVGSGMADSLEDFRSFVTPDVSMSDLIALGVVHAVFACGGPLIPFRAGRINAKGPGPATVPEPQQDLATHTEMFRKQGFTQSEMIQLVACGHTLGGVRNPDFPTIVLSEDTLTEFDNTDAFDNAVVTAYLNGTTRNPLVVAENITMISDQRIFSSDQNKTMEGMASPEAFSSICKDMLARMIDTVPKDVTLSDVIKPIEYKLGQQVLTVNSNDTITPKFRLRLLTENLNRVVTMFWKGAYGDDCTRQTCSSVAISTDEVFFSDIFHAAGVGSTPSKYLFMPAINATTSISKFWFEVDEKDGSAPIIVDQGSEVSQDILIWDYNRTVNEFDSQGIGKVLVVAVRKDAGEISRVSIEILKLDDTFVPTTEKSDMQPASSIPDTAHYTFYSARFNNLTFNGFTVSGDIGGKTYETDFIGIAVVDIP